MNPLYQDKINVYRYVEKEDPEFFTTVNGYKLILESINCDVQPYSSEKIEKQYGYKVETTKVIFIDIYPEITEECIIEYNSQFYKIQKIILWDKLLKHLEIAVIELKGDVDIIE